MKTYRETIKELNGSGMKIKEIAAQLKIQYEVCRDIHYSNIKCGELIYIPANPIHIDRIKRKKPNETVVIINDEETQFAWDNACVFI